MKKFLVSLALGLAAAVAFAVPSPKQIEQAMEHGQWAQARAMVNEVLAAKPDSARAHLLNAATILHIEKDVALAEQELNLAAELDKKGDVRNSRLFAKMRNDIAVAHAPLRAPPAQVQAYTPPVVAAPAPTPQPAVVTATKEEGSSFLTKFFWLVVLFAVGFGVFYWFRRKSAQPELASTLSSSSTVMGSTTSAPRDNYQSYASSRRTYVPPAPVYVPPQQSTGPSVLETAVGVAGGVVVGNMIHDAIAKPKVDETITRRRESDYSSSAPAPAPYFPEPAPAPATERYSSGSGSSWGDSNSYSSSTDDDSSSRSSSSSSWSSSSSSDSSSDSSWGSSDSSSSSSSGSSDW